MTSSNYAISYQARFSAGAAGLLVGDAVYFDAANDGFDLATPASLAAGARAAGVVAELGRGRGFILHSSGPIAPAVTGLAPGVQSWVRVSSAGRLERVLTPGEGDDIVGQCDASGLLHASFGTRYASGGGSSLPTGTGILSGYSDGMGAQGYEMVGGQGTPYLPDGGDGLGNVVVVVPNGDVGDVYTMGPEGPGWEPGGGGGGNPWADYPLENTLPVFGVGGEPFVKALDGEVTPLELRSDGTIGATSLAGRESDGGALLSLSKYNWPESGAALPAEYAEAIGHKVARWFAATASASTMTWAWPDESSATLDVVCSFSSGTATRRITRSYSAEKVAGTLTVTEDGTAFPQFDALAAVNVALSVGTGNVLALTITPGVGITNVFAEVSGHLMRRGA